METTELKSDKEILKLYFGANVYPAEIIKKYTFVSLSSGDAAKIADTLKAWKAAGYVTKKKSYSDFTYIKGVKLKN